LDWNTDFPDCSLNSFFDTQSEFRDLDFLLNDLLGSERACYGMRYLLALQARTLLFSNSSLKSFKNYTENQHKSILSRKIYEAC